MKVDLIVGERQSHSDEVALRGSASGAQSVALAHSLCTYAAMQKRLFRAATTGAATVLTANHCIGTAIPAAGAATPIIGIWNPAGSGEVLSVMRTRVATVSGTPAGPFLWGKLPTQEASKLASPQQADGVSYGAAGFSRAISETASRKLSSCWIIRDTALAASGTAANIGQVVEHELIGGPAAIATGAGIYNVDEETNGALLIYPGEFYGIFGYAAGTSHAVKASIVFEAFPLFLFS